MLFCQVAWDGKSNCENGWRILTRSWPSLVKGGRLRHLNPCAQLLATGLYKWQVLEIHISTFWCQKIASTVQVSLVFVNPEIIQHGSAAPQLFSQAVENVDSPQLHWASERLLTHKTEAVPTRTHAKKKVVKMDPTGDIIYPLSPAYMRPSQHPNVKYCQMTWSIAWDILNRTKYYKILEALLTYHACLKGFEVWTMTLPTQKNRP